MTSRERYRDIRVHYVGTRIEGQFEGDNYSDDGIREWCNDDVGDRHEDNPLDLKRWTTFAYRVDGHWPMGDPPWDVEFQHYPVENQVDPVDSRTPFSFDAFNLAQRAAALSNPSRPYVSVPQFIGEFRDFPKMLRDLPGLIKRNGDNLIEKVAKGHINWRFALKPLFNDLAKIANFQNAVNQRVRMLEKLREEKSLRRRASLGSDKHTDVIGTVYLQTAGFTFEVQKAIFYTQDVWATTRWQLESNVELPTGDKEIALWAKNLASGMTSKSAAFAAWDLIPWSWLVDWFLPIGDYLAANNNSVPVRCTSICLMRNTSSYAWYSNRTFIWLVVEGQHFQREDRKWRQIVSPLILLHPPLANLSFLNRGQLSILGSLVILKKGRY